MDRISTYLSSQSMLADMMRAQRELLDAQRTVSTGKRIQEFRDSSADIGPLMAARASDARAADYQTAAKAAESRLDIQNSYLEQLTSAAKDLRELVAQTVANNAGPALTPSVDGIFERIRSVLNASIDGKYLFGGTRQDVPPVTAASITDLAALPLVADAFQNNDAAPLARVDEGEELAVSQLASDLGAPMFQILRDFAVFEAGPNGPFGAQLTDAQRSFLQGLMPALQDAVSAATNDTAKNGVAYNAAKDAVARHDDTRIALASFISDIEDADMAEAVTRLNQSQLALQASAQAFAKVRPMSLLDFI